MIRMDRGRSWYATGLTLLQHLEMADESGGLFTGLYQQGKVPGGEPNHRFRLNAFTLVQQ